MADPSDSGTTTQTTVDPAGPMLSMGPTSEFARRGYTWSGTVLGRGSFGVALLVHRHEKQVDEAGRASLTNITPYVCKTPSLAQLTESDRKMIAREVVTLEYVSKKNHPHLVRFHTSFCEGDFLCIIMDYCNMGDLSRLIEAQRRSRRPLAEVHVRRALVQLTSAVDLLHHLQVMHRDIKPRNVFIHKGVLKLGDLGLSKQAAQGAAQKHTVCGSPIYAAPEVHVGVAYDLGVDIWSLGCTLYELMMLEYAFKGANDLEVHRKILAGAYGPVDSRHYSPALIGLLGSMLRVKRAERPSSLALLRDDYFADAIRDSRCLDAAALSHRRGHQLADADCRP